MSKTQSRINLDPSWAKVLEDEFDKAYMGVLREFLVGQKKSGKVIFPGGDEYFNALNRTPFDKVKVVILGQDPYHGPGQAHGLCFSVKPGIAIPPSLQNIFKEIDEDLGAGIPAHGCLTHWSDQGVLLLNSVLTVERGRAGSHQGQGWERFTDSVVLHLNEKKDGLVFLLWGSYAHKKGQIIDTCKHLVLKSPHPSPLSAHRGFFGNRHFSRANAYLEERGQAAIDWSN